MSSASNKALVHKVLGDPSLYPAALSSFLQRYISGNNLIQIGGNQLPDIEKTHAIGDTGNPVFLNSWDNYGSGYTDAGYYKDSSGVVHLEGTVKGGALSSIIFALPTGYRPASTVWYPVAGNAHYIETIEQSVSRTTPVSSSGTSFAAGTDILTTALSWTASASATYSLHIESYAWYNSTAGDSAVLSLNLDGADQGFFAQYQEPTANYTKELSKSVLFTAGAGSHTVNIRLWAGTGGTAVVYAGAGGAGTAMPITVTLRRWRLASLGSVQIDSSGNVAAETGDPNAFSLDGVSFRAA